jgi:hypothetical protein
VTKVDGPTTGGPPSSPVPGGSKNPDRKRFVEGDGLGTCRARHRGQGRPHARYEDRRRRVRHLEPNGQVGAASSVAAPFTI